MSSNYEGGNVDVVHPPSHERRSAQSQLAAADLPVIVINLDTRVDRWRLQQAQARLHRITIRRFRAMDAHAGRQRFPNSSLTPGATGMWHSFDSLVNQLATQGIRAAVVLEDDAILKPGFYSAARKYARDAPEGTALIQLGYLSDSSWRPQNSLLQNIKKTLRPKSRLRSVVRLTIHGRERSRHLRAGMHATLVFPSALANYLEKLRPEVAGTLPLDNAIVHASIDNPGAFARAGRSLAFQLPVASDITWSRAE